MSNLNETPNVEASTKPEFTTSMKALEKIVEQFKGGQLTMEESLTLFEQGVTHLKNCQVQLATTRGKVDVLIKGLETGGELVTEPFEH